MDLLNPPHIPCTSNEDRKPISKEDMEVQSLNFDELNRTEFNQKFKSCKSNLEKIQIIKKLCGGTLTGVDNFPETRKNSETSTEFREKGNRAYIKKNLGEALLNYNLAIRYAPPLSTQLGLAFANRSAVLQNQERFNEALADIQLALENSYPENLTQKLVTRNDVCRDKGRRKEEEIKKRQNLDKGSGSEDEGKHRYCEDVLFNITNPHKRIKCAMDFVEIRIDEIFGRHVVVTKDISPGTVLLVENPFVLTLKGEYEDRSMDHCSECFQRLNECGLPCSGCVHAFYCSAACREKSQSGHHKYECPLIPYLVSHKISWNIVMALRILCKVGPEELFQKYFLNDHKSHSCSTQIHNGNKEFDKSVIPGFSPENNIYDPANYESVYHLVSDHPENSEFPKVDTGTQNEIIDHNLRMAIQAYKLSQALCQYSTFFEGIPEESSPHFANFVASLLLKHISTVQFNSMSVDQIHLDAREEEILNQLEESELAERMKSLEFIQVGTGLYPLTSLLNHSCDPNIARFHANRNGTMAVVAIKPLRSGEQLFNCYGKFFGTCLLKERKDFLMHNYHFNCACAPCANDWPTLFQLRRKRHLTFRCPHCLGTSCLFAIKNQRWQVCVKCKRKVLTSGLQEQISKFLEKFKETYKLTLQNRQTDALEPLCELLQLIPNIVAPPFLQTFVAQETLKHALGVIANRS